MDRYLVLVWAKKQNPKRKSVALKLYSSNISNDWFGKDEIWVSVEADSADSAINKAKILWELT